MSEHLSQSQLEGYSGRKLDPDELLEVDRHLASCDECHERLSRIWPGVASPSFNSGEEAFHLDYEQHLEPYVDGTSNDIDREIVESHVALCSQCADELRDLLAFKHQPVAVVTGDARARSLWTGWLPQWRLLPNPSLAAGIGVAVFFAGLAALWWTRYPASQRVDHVGPSTGQPSPAATEQTAQTNSSSNDKQAEQTTPREEPLLVLNDGSGPVIVNKSGRLEGLQELPADLRESVERALATRRLRASPALKGWPTGAGILRSELEKKSTFAPLDPTDVVVETDRPTFHWTALEGAHEYVVTIYDSQLRQVGSSGPVDCTEWMTPKSLARGVTYSWQVSAVKDGQTVVSPKPPLPEARFRILDQSAEAALAKLKDSVGNSHLVLGIFYWKHGVIDKAEREFQLLAKANPNSPAAAELLKSIRSLRRR